MLISLDDEGSLLLRINNRVSHLFLNVYVCLNLLSDLQQGSLHEVHQEILIFSPQYFVGFLNCGGQQSKVKRECAF